ncbi:hypothetical protein HDU85_004673 [Gaertneriomyces sp. JEL0708]|nr:hypothetical protein HDU85_004673 [Gaertneriomyces sp. JEL0708]
MATEKLVATKNNDEGLHLVVLHHGLWGQAVHMRYLATHLVDRYANVRVLNFDGNRGDRTYDGVDVCGHRLAQAILDRLRLAPEITKLSIIGYSLGGLITRYAIGILESHHAFTEPSENLPHPVVPMNYISVAAPHAGADRPPTSLWTRMYNAASTVVISRSGKHMMMRDRDGVAGEPGTTRPLLDMMADPAFPFWRGLSRFTVRKAFANTLNDRVVGFTTSALEPSNHYRKGARWIVEDSKYPSIIKLVPEDISIQEDALSQPEELQREVDDNMATQSDEAVEKMALGATVVAATAASTAMTAPTAQSRRLIFYILLPIFLPFALLWMLSYYLMARKRHICDQTVINFAGEAGSKLIKEYVSSVRVDDMQVDVEDEYQLSPTQATRQSIIARLNKLSWTKISARITSPRSHALIVARPSYETSPDVMNYLIDTFVA